MGSTNYIIFRNAELKKKKKACDKEQIFVN
jgi:hypothetical protein